MKIIFICSGLEPGRDGVGDYTRRLAVELIRLGHSSAAVALNDKHTLEKADGIQFFENTNLPVLRIPAKISEKERFNHAKKYIDNFNPEWLSIQFVIFGYHAKGLPYGLGNRFKILGGNRNWHIMFHELWLGMEENTSKKYLLWGFAQRQIIKSLIFKLNPKVLHTHVGLYQHELKKLGVTAHYLALFSNIPNVYNNDKEINTPITGNSSKIVNLILFGNLHSDAPIKDFVDEVTNYATKNNAEIRLTIVGRCGAEQEKWAEKWAANGLNVQVLGEKSVYDISQILGAGTIGITTTPIALVEKSSAVAVMLEHNLPVICVARSWIPKNYEFHNELKGVSVYKKGNFESIILAKTTKQQTNSASVVAHKLITVLNNV